MRASCGSTRRRPRTAQGIVLLQTFPVEHDSWHDKSVCSQSFARHCISAASLPVACRLSRSMKTTPKVCLSGHAS
eukprot:5287422-Amphidinium_carterae.1